MACVLCITVAGNNTKSSIALDIPLTCHNSNLSTTSSTSDTTAGICTKVQSMVQKRTGVGKATETATAVAAVAVAAVITASSDSGLTISSTNARKALVVISEVFTTLLLRHGAKIKTTAAAYDSRGNEINSLSSAIDVAILITTILVTYNT